MKRDGEPFAGSGCGAGGSIGAAEPIPFPPVGTGRGESERPSFEADDLLGERVFAEAAAAAQPAIPPSGAAIRRLRLRRVTRADVRALGQRGRDRWLAASDNLRASLLMVASILIISVMMAAIKAIGTGLPLTQTLLIRQVLLTLLILPMFTADLRGAFRTRNLGLQLLRGVFALGSQYTYFLALLYLPFAEMTALGFSQVIFMTIAAVIFLKETVGVRRWIATGVGFVGVVIMLKPGAEVLNPYALVAIFSALLLSGVTLFIRLMAATETTAALLLYQSTVLCAAYLGPALYFWEWPTQREWILLGVIGIFGTIGQYLFTWAFKVGETAALAPLEFTRLLLAVAIGFLFFHEVPDVATILGASIVIGSTIYTVRRNAGG